jgi:hypothetical protein
MSSKQAFISRTLIVKSPYHLWQLLKDKDENWCTNTEIILFMYAFENLVNGCKCDRDKNINIVKFEYKSVSSSGKSIEIIKSMFNCQSVIFDENDNLFNKQLDTI